MIPKDDRFFLAILLLGPIAFLFSMMVVGDVLNGWGFDWFALVIFSICYFFVTSPIWIVVMDEMKKKRNSDFGGGE